MSIRKWASVALSGFFVAAALAMSPSPAAAAGGGCIDAVGNGWNVGVCSADDGVTVFADIYVNARGSLGSSCYIERYIARYSGSGTFEGAFSLRTDGCAAGHHSAITTPKLSGKLYRQYARVVVNGSTVNSGFSPYTW